MKEVSMNVSFIVGNDRLEDVLKLPFENKSVISIKEYSIRISKELINLRLPIEISNDCKSELVFPCITDGSYVVPDEFSDSDDKNWVDTFHFGDAVFMKKIGICVNSESGKTANKIEYNISSWFKIFLDNIFLLFPLSVIRSDYYCWDFNVSGKTIQGTAQHSGTIVFTDEISKSVVLNLEDIKTAAANTGKQLTIQASLLVNARKFFHSKDYRNCILSCSTIIEITLNQQIENYFSVEKNCPKEVIESIIKQYRGLDGSRELLSKFEVLDKDFNTQINIVVGRRNAAIHKGSNVIKEDAEGVLKFANKILEKYKIYFFE